MPAASPVCVSIQAISNEARNRSTVILPQELPHCRTTRAKRDGLTYPPNMLNGNGTHYLLQSSAVAAMQTMNHYGEIHVNPVVQAQARGPERMCLYYRIPHASCHCPSPLTVFFFEEQGFTGQGHAETNLDTPTLTVCMDVLLQ
jgi:hypothetical protein